MIQHAVRPTDSYYLEAELWLRGRNAIVFVALISWVASAVGWVTDPARFYQSYLVGFLFCVTIPLAGMFFIMIG